MRCRLMDLPFSRQVRSIEIEPSLFLRIKSLFACVTTVRASKRSICHAYSSVSIVLIRVVIAAAGSALSVSKNLCCQCYRGKIFTGLEKAVQKPNVLLFYMDDLRPELSRKERRSSLTQPQSISEKNACKTKRLGESSITFKSPNQKKMTNKGVRIMLLGRFG